MSNQNFIIPRKLKVGFQQRNQSLDGRLSFITYIEPNGSTFNEGRFNSWIDKSIDVEEIDNSPKSGFVLGEGVEHGGYYNNSTFYVRLYCTSHDVEFEIEMNDFLALATYTKIDKRYIEGDCVLAWKNKRLTLISVHDPLYISAKEASNVLYGDIKIQEKEKYEMGDIFIIKKHKKKGLLGINIVYLGQHDVHQANYNGKMRLKDFKYDSENDKFEILKKFKPKHIFAIFYQNVIQNDRLSYKSELLLYDNINPEELNFIGSVDDYPNKTIEGENHQRVPLSDIKTNGIQAEYIKDIFNCYIGQTIDSMATKSEVSDAIRYHRELYIITEDKEIIFLPRTNLTLDELIKNVGKTKCQKVTFENGKIKHTPSSINIDKKIHCFRASNGLIISGE